MWKMLVLSGALIASSLHAQSASRAATDDEVAAIQAGSVTSLKDAPSAIFRDVMVRDIDSSHVAFCGLVNAKNSYGGYSGFSRFYGVGNNSKTPMTAGVMFTDDGNPPGMASQMCMRNGFN